MCGYGCITATARLDRILNFVMTDFDRGRRLENFASLRGHFFKHVFVVFCLQRVSDSETIHGILFLLGKATSWCARKTLQISRGNWTIVASIDSVEVYLRSSSHGRYVFVLFCVLLCNGINGRFSLFIRILISVQNQPLFKLVLLS